MYLRRCYRQKDGKRHGYWALVESYRSSRGPRQRVVAYLGEMDAAGRLGIHQQAAGAAAVAQVNADSGGNANSFCRLAE
jgi:hypothetical protein